MARSTKIIPALAFVSLAAGALASTPPAAAVDPYDGNWHFTLTPFLWVPNVNGNIDAHIPGRRPTGEPQEVDVSTEIGPNDYLENLTFGAMLNGEARKGDWSVFTHFIYIDFGDQRSHVRNLTGPRGESLSAIDRDVTTGLSTTVWTLAGAYTAVRTPKATVDVLAGFRYVEVDTELKWSLRGSSDFVDNSGRKSQNQTEWDGIVGVKGQVRLGDGRWFMPYYADIGTGSSNLTWQALLGLGYGFDWGDVSLSIRSLSYDFDKNDADLRMTGPALGASFHW